MNSEQTPRERELAAQRDAWRGRCAEAKEMLLHLEGEYQRLAAERDMWRETANMHSEAEEMQKGLADGFRAYGENLERLVHQERIRRHDAMLRCGRAVQEARRVAEQIVADTEAQCGELIRLAEAERDELADEVGGVRNARDELQRALDEERRLRVQEQEAHEKARRQWEDERAALEDHPRRVKAAVKDEAKRLEKQGDEIDIA